MPPQDNSNNNNNKNRKRGYEDDNCKNDTMQLLIAPRRETRTNENGLRHPKHNFRVLATLLSRHVHNLGDGGSWEFPKDDSYPSKNIEDHQRLILSTLDGGLAGLPSLGHAPVSWKITQRVASYVPGTEQGSSAADFLMKGRAKNMRYCVNTQKNLFELRHAGGCRGYRSDGKPCDIGNCKKTRDLWKHLAACPKVQYYDWVSSWTLISGSLEIVSTQIPVADGRGGSS